MEVEKREASAPDFFYYSCSDWCFECIVICLLFIRKLIEETLGRILFWETYLNFLSNSQPALLSQIPRQSNKQEENAVL